jgi:hypothetical protein
MHYLTTAQLADLLTQRVGRRITPLRVRQLAATRRVAPAHRTAAGRGGVSLWTAEQADLLIPRATGGAGHTRQD